MSFFLVAHGRAEDIIEARTADLAKHVLILSRITKEVLEHLIEAHDLSRSDYQKAFLIAFDVEKDIIEDEFLIKEVDGNYGMTPKDIMDIPREIYDLYNPPKHSWNKLLRN